MRLCYIEYQNGEFLCYSKEINTDNLNIKEHINLVKCKTVLNVLIVNSAEHLIIDQKIGLIGGNNMSRIIIYKNPNGDTRTAPKNISFEQFQEANDMHIQDVRNVMNNLALRIMITGTLHDSTKKTAEQLFYKNFISTMNDGTDFVNDRWYQFHIKEERHHLLSNCPDDVNLIDVLEMITDCVCAGMARSGEVRPIEINTEILEKALTNTVDLVKNMVVSK